MGDPEPQVIPELSLDFVSKLVGKKVISFTIKPGTAPGDNYMSVLYCLKCTVQENGAEEIVYGISKCYPSHPMRQQFLNKSNIFWNELKIYDEFIPALKKLQDKLGAGLKMPFAPLISGSAINYGKGKENEENLAGKYAGKVFGPFDNYILMVDLKNTYGFRMSNRLVGLSLDEVSLVMAEHSKIHALGWAYKLKNGLNSLSSKFPYLDFEMNPEDTAMFMNVMNGCVAKAIETLKAVEGLNPAILDGVETFKGNMEAIMMSMFDDKYKNPKPIEEFLRIKMIKDEKMRAADNVPWRVLVHGDCWVNNLLFRYDKDTKRAIELVLVDLQMMRESCPTQDLVYLLYSSTTAEFRKKHLDDMLKLYHTKFMSYCDELGVDYLPGYSLAALKRRFHASKLVGLQLCLMVLPVILKEDKDIRDMEKMEGVEDLVDMFENVMGASDENAKYKERLVAVVQELYNEGVI